jgi:plasmid stabilization system protein ParE
MPEIVWKQGAENDLFHIFADLEDRSEGSGERFVQKLDFTLENLRIHPEMAPTLRGADASPCYRLNRLRLVLYG